MESRSCFTRSGIIFAYALTFLHFLRGGSNAFKKWYFFNWLSRKPGQAFQSVKWETIFKHEHILIAILSTSWLSDIVFCGINDKYKIVLWKKMIVYFCDGFWLVWRVSQGGRQNGRASETSVRYTSDLLDSQLDFSHCPQMDFFSKTHPLCRGSMAMRASSRANAKMMTR